MAETPPERFLAFLPSLFEQGRPLEILEVGGGSVSHVAVPGARYTVLDADAASVSRNAYADQVLIGDIQACDLPAHRFDAIVFWNVLEHVGEPERAVASAVRALKPHGVLIVRGPMIRSLKALVTRLTPHGFHVLFYRRVLGHPHAGEPGRAPFPTALSDGADADALTERLSRMGFRVLFEERYVGDQVELLRAFSRTVHGCYEAVSWLLRLVTNARWGSRESDFVTVYRREAPSRETVEPVRAEAFEAASRPA